jgi:hypothetical protein
MIFCGLEEPFGFPALIFFSIVKLAVLWPFFFFEVLFDGFY